MLQWLEELDLGFAKRFSECLHLFDEMDVERPMANEKRVLNCRVYKTRWLLLAWISVALKVNFFAFTDNSLSYYFASPKNAFSMINLQLLIFVNGGLAFCLYFVGPITKYHVIGSAGKFIMLGISLCGVIILKQLVEDIKYCYALISLNVELQVYRELLFNSKDYGSWDVLFLITLQIIIVNLIKDGNLWVFIPTFLLWRLINHRYKSNPSCFKSKQF
ncbi:uncharacterized protein LOC110009776 [Jatropha curcas]|uniref:uncharacterized protein LOC110009776 n=1 Tax=Jatropha curcas TaxID=180498 RepID=UPI0009D762EF|nr:uncharacterized protein LOC110009776 [Jatropha curcas]